MWYIGYTKDLRRRIAEHVEKRGGKTTQNKKGSWELIYYEAYKNKQDAIGREKFLKGGSGRVYLRKQLAHHTKKKQGGNKYLE
ncbi:GIY-YIG nuclease family protein [Candidatus Kaiserbacteria bacterium]|nr:MAG: GIY-YIG nuclease family protein [Candidatus Kaiserbacteria bacterium]